MSNLNYTPPKSVKEFLTSEAFISLIVGPIGCLAGDSLVITEDGPTPIASITRPTRVLSWNEKTCQYQLSMSSVAFPKGTDYLYQVTTPQGKFVAAGQHLLLCADGVYRRVQDLVAGDVLKTCSDTQRLTSLGLDQLELPLDDRNYCQTHASCSGGYEVSDRLCGLLTLCLKEGVLNVAPEHSGAQICIQPSDFSERGQLNDLQAELLARTRSELSAYLQQTGGSAYPYEPRKISVASHVLEESCGYAEGFYPVPEQSAQTCEPRLQGGERSQLVQCLDLAQDGPCLKSTERPIIAITRQEKKEIYWDIQVNGTHNYVTVDGAIHHNSTKTTAGIMKIAYHAKQMAPCRDGIRRSKAVWVRNTREQLRDTSIPDVLRWYPDGQAGVYMKSDYKFILRFDDVEAEILFRGLDDSHDVRRLLSLQASFGILDEFREINPDVFNALQGRIGRYPSKLDNGVGCVADDGSPNMHIWGMSNPPDLDTFWETYLSDPPGNAKCFFQPSGLSQEADWTEFLPVGYYENLAEGKSEDWIDVYINAKFGKSLSGQPVFRAFNRDIHVSSKPLNYIKLSTNPLIIGHDFGLTPAATVSQIDPHGRFLTYAELVSDGMGEVRFIREKLKPLLNNRFPGMPVLVVGDPAGRQRAQTDERSVFDILKQEGFRVIAAKTNSIVARLSAVDTLLTRMVDGKPAMLIDPECKTLINALRGGYRYKIKTNGDADDRPEKNSYSHIADSFQYACLHADGNITGSALAPKARMVEKNTFVWN